MWFEKDAEQAAGFYASLFKKSRVTGKEKYGKAGADVSGMPK
ncbi:VOC family protein [Candidatus Micrarchaeota archaeon]|nr:VOC family protein [Candidatus Micrarchaeota archaeon]